MSGLVEIAADLRRRAGELSPAYSTHRIVEVAFPNAVVAGRTLPERILEAVARTPDGPVIVYARRLPTPAQRFVIAHALAHLLFDGRRAFRQPGEPRDPAVEDRADRFADELLVPLSELERHVERWPAANPVQHEIYLDHVDEIASRFCVMSDVIDRRIRELELLVRKSA